MQIIIIGSSTGGPRILFSLFDGLTVKDSAIIIVQHMPPSTTPRMVKRLSQLSNIPVIQPVSGELITRGTCYIAPGDYHLILENNSKIFLTESEKVNYVRPSIDVTMMSVVQRSNDHFLGIILSGMGSDGAAGIEYLKSIGAKTIAQDPDTATIRSMPEAAIRTQKIDDILAASLIKERIARF